jgi:hypothetical protein
LIVMGHEKKINQFLKKMGDLGPLDEDGQCVLVKGNAKVEVKVCEEEDLLAVASPVISLPRENILPLFRRLLTLNFEDTRDAAFALDDDTDKIELHVKRPLENLEYEEFSRAVTTVAEVADEYNDELAGVFGAELEPVKAHSGTLKNYLSVVNPVSAAQLAKQERIRGQRIGSIFYFLGILVGAGAGITMYLLSKSWPLAIFVYIWGVWVVGRALPSLITDPEKVKRLIFFALYPVIATGILFLTYWLWDKWWLAVLLGCLAGWILAPIIGALAMPGILEEEAEEDQERLRRMWRMHGGLKGEA